MTMLIDANGISMKYPGSSRLVLDNVNFSINEGEFIVIAGDSGSGKSTLLAILGGILRPVEGVVKYKEKNMYEMNENEISDMHRSKVGYVPQSNIMLKTYSVLENIIVPYRLGTGEKSVSDLEEHISIWISLELKIYLTGIHMNCRVVNLKEYLLQEQC